MKVPKKIVSIILVITLVLSVFSIVSFGAFSQKIDDTSSVSASPADFSWDNASVYFLLTDRFLNGNTTNDHSYNRLIDKDGSVVTNSRLNSDVATFHGGDFAGITKKINDGYFDNLGVNAIWMSAPYEQIHGYVIVNEGKSNSIKHYAYHGYYALDYSQTDANFGTAEEFRTLVNTAHKHGIRIVLDVVMNHPGYNTLYDMHEFNYGAYRSGYDWNKISDIYYDWKFNGHYHEGINYNGGGAYNEGWCNWWNKDWLRCGIDGYTPFGGDDRTKSAGGDLPDFKTESNSTVSVPTFLTKKWEKEGRLSKENQKLNSYFSSTGKQKTVRNYLVYWLSQWVEQYGVDGFRCDTAKHVEFESWKALKDQCNISLKKWRQNNSSDIASKWTDDFWMTAEDYGAGVNYDDYYKLGGFDSKINFSFTGGGGVPSTGNINNVYKDYANRINTNDKFNALTYISSHDTALCRNDLYYQGSAFQLLPGAIQIFYGDESNRKVLNSTVGGEGDHLVRSDMNWSSTDSNVLSHWQKVGKFRKNHIAVGAGSHNDVSVSNGLGFSRIYNKNGINDKVIAVIGASNNTNVDITVSSCFSDGTTLRNAYDNKTAVVKGGKVTFSSGAHGTILIESTSIIPPTTPTETSSTTPSSETTKPTETYEPSTLILGDSDLNKMVDILDAQVIQKDQANIKKLTPNGKICADVDKKGLDIVDATLIQKYLVHFDIPYDIGKPIGDIPTSPTESSEPITQSDPTEPTSSSDKNLIYVDMGQERDTTAYYWKDGSEGPKAWPGYNMNHVGGTIYSIEVEKEYNKIIFSFSGSEQTGDLDIPGSSYIYYKNSGEWKPYTIGPTQPTEAPEGNLIYADMGYQGEIKAYYWQDGSEGPKAWPGYDMEHVNGTIYKISVPTQYNKIIFSNNGSDQTANLDIVGNNKIWSKNTNSWDDYN